MPSQDNKKSADQPKPQLEKRTFEAEVKQLLDLVAHSLYSHAEIFLRELISNASDAADKLRYEALSDAALYEKDSTLKIWISFDAKAKTITLRDNGIGMTREDIIDNLGTIAKSGTSAFRQLIESKKEGSDAALIGKFGVGFYSSFVVADKVVVQSRRAGTQPNQGVAWVSNGQGEYSVENIEKGARGTEITLHLKKEHAEFAANSRLREIITKYSDHILLPIEMKKFTWDEKQKKDIETDEWETVNQANALWTMPKKEIKEEDYLNLYKHISHDFEEPLAWTHNRVEGKLEYINLLYIPKRAPFDLYWREQKKGLKLYVKRVFIMDDAEHFMPMYLRFVKGIVDANDLPLNISRELLQSNQTIDKIKTACVKRVLSLLENLAKNDTEKYQLFWKEFGPVLKEGVVEDYGNKERISKLLRFSSTHTNEEAQTVSFDDYVSRMKEGQDKIFTVISDNFVAAKSSPLLELFAQKGIEVLLLSDRVDEYLVSHLNTYDGKTLQSIAKGSLDLGKLDDKAEDEQEKKSRKQWKKILKVY